MGIKSDTNLTHELSIGDRVLQGQLRPQELGDDHRAAQEGPHQDPRHQPGAGTLFSAVVKFTMVI